MRRKKFLVLLIVSLLLGSVNVWAEEEAEWVPDDAFYMEYAEECVAMNREYFANGPNKKVIVYESPASAEVVKTMKNGDVVLIDYTYTNSEGIEWGFCEFEGEFGWLPMPYMVPVYDYLCFEEEYGEQFQTVKADLIRAGGFYDSNRKIKFWSYPGSSKKFTIAFGQWMSFMPQYTKVFVDEDGRKWGFVGYFSGKNLNSWVCLSSVDEMLADFDELYPNGAPERDKREIKPYDGKKIFPDNYVYVKTMQIVKTAAIVLGIVAVGGALMLFYWKMWKNVKKA